MLIILLLFVRTFSDVLATKVAKEDFKFKYRIAKGGFGRVYLATPRTNDTCYAIKVLNKADYVSDNDFKKIQMEREIPADIDHPFIVKLLFTFQSKSKLFFGFDWAEGGDLLGCIRKFGIFNEGNARFYACEIVLALEFLHENGVVHRDVKSSNILIDAEGHAKLADFGLCKRLKIGERTLTQCGTLFYKAPEIFGQKPYGHEVDWWGLGVVLYEMLHGTTPFAGYLNSPQAICTREARFRGKLMDETKDILDMFLRKNPERRLGSDGTDVIKGHPFFQSIDWEKVENRKLKPPIDARRDRPSSFFQKIFGKHKPRNSDSQDSISEEDQELFKDFSYVSPDVDVNVFNNEVLEEEESSSSGNKCLKCFG